jgi:hypothetical protein
MAFRIVAALMVVAVAVTGVLPTRALAQPAVPAAPAPPPAQPPELYQERLKDAPPERSDAGYSIGAAAVNTFYVPGKVILCTLGGAVSVGILALTFGSAYRAAAAATREGCGGRWYVRGEDLKPDRERDRFRDWERN